MELSSSTNYIIRIRVIRVMRLSVGLVFARDPSRAERRLLINSLRNDTLNDMFVHAKNI